MKNARPQTAKTSAGIDNRIVSQAKPLLDAQPSDRLYLTPTPRMKRALEALLTHSSLTREQLDDIAGCSNAPGLVLEMRRAGLEVKCKQELIKDRDGRPCYRGRYSLTDTDKVLVRHWLAEVNTTPRLS